MKLITSKITIPTETPLVCRQGLLDTLRENLESCHTTVINGRAGAGKTMLAVDFVRRHVGLAAWYKVDAPDISLPVFMEYLVASVASVRPGFGRQTLERLARSHEKGREEGGGEFDVAGLAEAYVYDLERLAEPLVLVIDNCFKRALAGSKLVGSGDLAPVTGYYRPGRGDFEAGWSFILGRFHRDSSSSRVNRLRLSKSRR